MENSTGSHDQSARSHPHNWHQPGPGRGEGEADEIFKQLCNAPTEGVMLCNRDIDLQKVPGVDDLLGDYVEARFGEGGPW